MRFELKTLLIPIGIILGFFLLKFTIGYLLPFILAILVALLIEPAVQFFQKRTHLSRGVAVFLVLLLILIIFAIFVVAGVSRIYVELEKLSKNLPSYQSLWEKYQWIKNHNEELGRKMERWELSPAQQEAVNRILQDLYSAVTNNLKNFISELLGLLTTLPNIITLFIISFIATFFISRDRQMIAGAFWNIFPKELQNKMQYVKNEITGAVIGFIRAELILISITTIIAIIGLEILSSDYALIIGFASGVLDLIPVVGPSLIFIPWAIYSMVSGDFAYGLGLLIVYGVMAVVREIAEARIIGKSIGIHPLAILFAIYVGVKAFGVSGFFIGPAVVVTLNALTKAGIINIFAAKRE
ncbi:sporulation integral membrane protein YtvI [Anoxybacter fermentans]|uniref:Sporulation integral membrane protein YtvI n=1 Tax=Anoxybacter fermentans TaxID=1323375 RepID=A0A3Q9HP68_9FIRM|nr:sporulation integral membrane protein YtvI [Anoxybacter fermentans]AZR72378.1 sporulation integral membrane protein YtvI [Anoxybacter fermentans]